MKKIIILILMMNVWVFAHVAIVKTMTGEVNVKRSKETISISIGSTLENGDIIISKTKSAIGIMFNDGTTIGLGEKTIFVINNFVVEPSKNEYDLDVSLEKGKAVFKSEKIGKLAPESVKFRIPEGIIGVRGTKFAVEVK